jgi:hypothetical protein
MIELAQVVKDLRSELYRAIDDGMDEPLQFDLGPVELELSMGVEQTDGVHGKVRFWVVDLGGDMSDKNLASQRIKLTLSPTIQLGNGQRVTPRVSGQAEDGED